MGRESGRLDEKLVKLQKYPLCTGNQLWGVREKGHAGNTQIFLQWAPNREFDFKKYLIWRKENGKEFVRISESNVNNTATFTDMTARPGVCYTYAVEAENYSGKRSGLSPEITID